MEDKLLIVQVTKDRENAFTLLKSLASKIRLDILDLLNVTFAQIAPKP